MSTFLDQCKQTHADLVSARAARLESECVGYAAEEALFCQEHPAVRYSDVIRMVAAERRAEREAAQEVA